MRHAGRLGLDVRNWHEPCQLRTGERDRLELFVHRGDCAPLAQRPVHTDARATEQAPESRLRRRLLGHWFAPVERQVTVVDLEGQDAEAGVPKPAELSAEGVASPKTSFGGVGMSSVFIIAATSH